MYGLMNAVQNAPANLDYRPEGNMFSPIIDDTDFYTRMNAGEFDDMANNPEMNNAVMGYMMKPESSGRGQLDTSASDHQLGLSANRDTSRDNQATGLGGLMSMAQTGQRQQPQPKRNMVQQGLMNPWGG